MRSLFTVLALLSLSCVQADISIVANHCRFQKAKADCIASGVDGTSTVFSSKVSCSPCTWDASDSSCTHPPKKGATKQDCTAAVKALTKLDKNKRTTKTTTCFEIAKDKTSCEKAYVQTVKFGSTQLCVECFMDSDGSCAQRNTKALAC
jgi:hypothetical protein